MKLTPLLSRLGLSVTEAEVYLSLIKHRQATPSQISKDTGIKRPTCYLTLEQLKQQGIVVRIKNSKPIAFQAVSPEYLLEKKQTEVEKLEKTFNKELQSLPHLQNLPQATIYQGIEGVKNVMDHTLTAQHTDIVGWANVELIYEPDEIINSHAISYHRRRIEKGIWIRSLYNAGPFGLRLRNERASFLRESYLISMEDFPLVGELKIFDDKVISISTADMIGVIIQNRHIADTYRSIFQHHFDYAREHESELLTETERKMLHS